MSPVFTMSTQKRKKRLFSGLMTYHHPGT